MKKKLLLLLCLLVTAGSAARAQIGQGAVGNGTWMLEENGKLTLNINGKMKDYGEGKAPWYGYADRIKSIHIGPNCKNVGRNGFYGLSYVESVTGGENVESVAMYAFEACGIAGDGIPQIYFPKCSYVGECAFAHCGAKAISLPLVETWKVAAITGGRDTYGFSDEYNKGSGLNACDFLDLGSKTKMLRPGSLMGPLYVFCQNPTPPDWERLYDKDEGPLAIRVVTDIVAGALTWGVGTVFTEIIYLITGFDRGREYEYPFGDHSDVKVIVPQEYLQTYRDYYPSEHPEVSSGYMCAYYADPDDHSKKGKTKSTGKLCAGAPIYQDGKLIGGWYVEDSELHVALNLDEMPAWTADNAPWKSQLGNARRIYIHSKCEEFKVPDDCFNGGKAFNKVHYVRFSGMDRLVIGDRAFKNCPDLESVENDDAHGKWLMPVTIGKEAFSGCPSFFVLDQFDVTALGESAFYGCTKYGNNYGSANFSISNIPEAAFYGCKNLDKFDFSKVRTISKRAFGGGSGLDEVNLSNCTVVGEEAFSNGTMAKIIFGPSTFACTFGSKCFAGCTQLGNVFVSSVLDTDLPSDIFEGVTLSDVTLHCKPDIYGEHYEDDDIFGKMKVDRDFTFPVEGTLIGGASGSHWSLSSAGTLQIHCNSRPIPDYESNRNQPWYQYREWVKDIVLNDCNKIGKNAFSELKNVKNVSIPRDCKEISDEAFKGCETLQNIYITRVEKLGNNVFEGCTSLKTIELGTHLASAGDYIFKDCHSLIDIENLNSTPATTTKNSFAGIKSGVYNLRGGPRKANDGQETVNLTVPDAYVTKYMLDENWSKFHIAYADDRGTWVKAGKYGDGMWILYDDNTMVISANKNNPNEDEYSIGFWAKSGDQSNAPVMLTKKIEFAGNLTEVGPYFYDFKNLENVKLCPSINNIKQGAFTGCEKLVNINLENVNIIGNNAFRNTGFDVIDLTSVKEIGNGAFSQCQNLVAAKLGPVCKLGASTFNSCSKLTMIDLSGADLEKASQCFAGCTSLKFAGVNSTRLCGGLFAGCTSLKAINLGSKLESIEYDAFDDCNNLDTIYVDRPTPPALPKGERLVQHGDVDYEFVEAWPFDGLTLKNIHLVVPPAFIAAYKKANIWKDMTIEGDVEVVEPAFPMGGSLYGCGKDMDGQPVEGCTWSLDEEGNFVISGVGGIAAFDKDGKPWCETFNSLASLIRNITVTDQVTSIPHDFFGGENFAAISENAETITLGEGLIKVGKNSLSFSGVKNVYIYSGEMLGLWESVFNQDAAVTNDATLHVLSDAGFNRYQSYYKSNAATKRFPHIVADLTQADPKVEDIRFPIAELTMYVDQTIDLYELNPEFTPANVKNKTLRFKNLLTSGNVYINDEGKMTALWEGKAYIEAWSSYTTDGNEIQALWGPDGSSTYLKVTITEAPKPEHFFFDYVAGEGTEAARITCHVLKNEHIDVDTNIQTCEIAGYFNEDDVTTQAIPEWMTGNVEIPEEAMDFDVVRIGAYSFYERNLSALYIPWTVTQIGSYACAYCDYLTDVYIPSFHPLQFTDAYGEPLEESMGHNDAFSMIGRGDDGEGYATLHVPAGSKTAWDIYPWNEWFRVITDDAEIPDAINEVKSEELRMKTVGSWFSLDGRKLGSKPAKAGLYIHNGKKVVIK